MWPASTSRRASTRWSACRRTARSATFNGPLVSYESQYRREGRVLHVSRSITDRMPANQCSPELMADYLAALKPVLDDLRQQVLYK